MSTSTYLFQPELDLSSPLSSEFWIITGIFPFSGDTEEFCSNSRSVTVRSALMLGVKSNWVPTRLNSISVCGDTTTLRSVTTVELVISRTIGRSSPIKSWDTSLLAVSRVGVASTLVWPRFCNAWIRAVKWSFTIWKLMPSPMVRSAFSSELLLFCQPPPSQCPSWLPGMVK